MGQVICPAAELDMATAPQLGARIIEAMDRGARSLVIDMRGVRMVDSAAIGVLLSAQRRLRGAGCDLIVRNASPHVRRVFALTGVERALRLEG